MLQARHRHIAWGSTHTVNLDLMGLCVWAHFLLVLEETIAPHIADGLYSACRHNFAVYAVLNCELAAKFM